MCVIQTGSSIGIIGATHDKVCVWPNLPILLWGTCRVGILSLLRVCRMSKIHFHEEWQKIEGYVGHEVSSLGNVRSLTRWVQNAKRSYIKQAAVMKLIHNSCGYCVVNLSTNAVITQHRVHRLVAAAFLPNPKNYKLVNHLNGVRDDNRVENLEWCDHSRNTKHAYEIGLCVGRAGELNSQAKLTTEQVRLIRKLRDEGMRVPAICEVTQINRSTVKNIFYNTRWESIA